MEVGQSCRKSDLCFFFFFKWKLPRATEAEQCSLQNTNHTISASQREVVRSARGVVKPRWQQANTFIGRRTANKQETKGLCFLHPASGPSPKPHPRNKHKTVSSAYSVNLVVNFFKITQCCCFFVCPPPKKKTTESYGVRNLGSINI